MLGSSGFLPERFQLQIRVQKRASMIKIFALAVAAILCVGGSTYGQPGPTSSMAEPVAPPGDATMHRHFGFFLRPDLGAGYMVTSEPTGTTSGDLTISGPAGVFGFAIGGECFAILGPICDRL